MILKTLSLFPMAQPQDCFEHRYLRDTGAAFGNRLRRHLLPAAVLRGEGGMRGGENMKLREQSH